jgi:hypothetical protein
VGQSCKGIGAVNAANQPSSIAVLSGTLSLTY